MGISPFVCVLARHKFMAQLRYSAEVRDTPEGGFAQSAFVAKKSCLATFGAWAPLPGASPRIHSGAAPGQDEYLS